MCQLCLFLWSSQSHHKAVLLSILSEVEVWLLCVSRSEYLRPIVYSKKRSGNQYLSIPFETQVDSHFCCNCLENIPSGEAKLKRNQCNKCFDCPSCQHTLSSRATTVQPKKPEGDAGKSAAADLKPKKMYYLTCLACRWTSRDVGIPDQPTGKQRRAT